MGTVGEMVQAGGVLLGGPQITKLMAGTDEAAVAAVVTGAMSGTALVELLAALRHLGIWDAEVLELVWDGGYGDLSEPEEYERAGFKTWDGKHLDSDAVFREGQRVRVIVLKGE